MRLLITTGPTREPIDPVRYLGNRSSGQMGAALAEAAIKSKHEVTLIAGPVTTAMPGAAKRINVETTEQMHEAVLREFLSHDLLLMAAAVADFRPKNVRPEKLERGGNLTIELEPTPDIVAAAGRMKTVGQRTVGFSLLESGNLTRNMDKIRRKNLDLIVCNPLGTMNSPSIEATLLWPDGHSEELPCRSKGEFADNLLQRAVELFL